LFIGVSNQKPSWQGEEIHLVQIVIKSLLCLSHHCCDHPVKEVACEANMLGWD